MTNTLHTAKTGMSMDTGYREGRGGGGGGGGGRRGQLYMLMCNDVGNFKLGKYYFLCIEW